MSGVKTAAAICRTRVIHAQRTILPRQGPTGIVSCIQRQHLLCYVHGLCQDRRCQESTALLLQGSAYLSDPCYGGYELEFYFAYVRLRSFIAHVGPGAMSTMFSLEHDEKTKQRQEKRKEDERLALKNKHVRRRVRKYDRRDDRSSVKVRASPN